jgi:hypothetical protein
MGGSKAGARAGVGMEVGRSAGVGVVLEMMAVISACSSSSRVMVVVTEEEPWARVKRNDASRSCQRDSLASTVMSDLMRLTCLFLGTIVLGLGSYRVLDVHRSGVLEGRRRDARRGS